MADDDRQSNGSADLPDKVLPPPKKYKFKLPYLPFKRLADGTYVRKEDVMSPPSSPATSPRPVEIEVKEEILSPTKPTDSKKSDSDGSSLPDNPEERPEAEEEGEQWKEGHYRNEYLEGLTARWRSEYAVNVPNPIVHTYMGKPNVPKDSRKQSDRFTPTAMAKYLMDRMPEEILNGTPIEQWDSYSFTQKVRTPRRKRISMSSDDGNAYSSTRHRSSSPTKDDAIDGIYDPNEPLFAETKPPGMDDDAKPPTMEGEERVVRSLNAEDLLFSDDTKDFDEYNEAICKEEPSTSQEVADNIIPADHQEALERRNRPNVLRVVEVAKPRLMYPAYLLDRSLPRQMERDLLAVLCALCDIQQVNVSRSNWFAVLLRKAEQTIQQLIAIENRRRRDAEIASEQRNHLKNRIAILVAKKRSFDEATAAGIHIRTGNQRTLAEGRVPPSIAGAAVTLKPSDSNVPHRAVMVKNYRVNSTTASTTPQRQPGSYAMNAPRSIDRPLVGSPYHIIAQRRAQNGIPATALLAEPGQPVRRAYSPGGRYTVTPMVRRQPQSLSRPIVATIRFPTAPLQRPALHPQGFIRPQVPDRPGSPLRFFTNRNS